MKSTRQALTARRHRPGRALRMPAEERRAQVLDAAEIAFSSRSYRDVGTAEVAAEAGVSEPTLYRHFASKRDLYLAMLDRNADRLLATWREIAAASPDAMSGLREIGRWYFGQLQRNPTPFLLRSRSLLEVAADKKLAQRARKHFWETFEFIQGLYEQARAEGRIPRETDARAQAWLFMAVGGLLDQFLLMGLEGLDAAELQRMMDVVRPPILDPPHGGRPAAAKKP